MFASSNSAGSGAEVFALISRQMGPTTDFRSKTAVNSCAAAVGARQTLAPRSLDLRAY